MEISGLDMYRFWGTGIQRIRVNKSDSLCLASLEKQHCSFSPHPTPKTTVVLNAANPNQTFINTEVTTLFPMNFTVTSVITVFGGCGEHWIFILLHK